MSSPPPIVPLTPYFDVSRKLTQLAADIYSEIGDEIKARQYLYNRAAFYEDLALAIRLLLDKQIAPFSASYRTWLWWADQLDIRAGQLGADPVYTMLLPPPRDDDPYTQYQQITNQLDAVVTFMLSVYRQEETDLQDSPLGEITGAECVKLSHRLAYYVLPEYCYDIVKPTPNHPGQRVTWKWLRAAADEFYKLYRAMGEPSVAGGWGPGGGEIPPISWPE